MSIEAKLLHLQAIQNLLAPYRFLYCVDLEATCDEIGESESPRALTVLPDQMETSEIDLVVTDLESLEIVDEFQSFVRPQINPILTEFFRQLTSIQQADIDGAGIYVEAGQKLGAFIARYPNAAWHRGVAMMQGSLRETQGLLRALPYSKVCYIFNARKWHAGLYDNRPKGLKQTVETLGLVW